MNAVRLVATLSILCAIHVQAAVTTDFSGDWNGTWSSTMYPGRSSWMKVTGMRQNGSSLSGWLEFMTTYYGAFSMSISGTAYGSTGEFYGSIVVDGETYRIQYTNARISSNGTQTTGNYTITEGGSLWDYGTFTMTRPIFTVSAQSNPTAGGTVTGGDTFPKHAYCLLSAYPNAGYEFQYWKAGSTVVGFSPYYAFSVTGTQTLTAYFTMIPATLSVSPTSLRVPNTASVISIGITNRGVLFTMPWTAEVINTGEAWASLSSPTNGTGNGTLTLSCTANPTGGIARDVNVRITAPGAIGSPFTLAITQDGGDLASAVEGTVGVALSYTLPPNFDIRGIQEAPKALIPAGLKWDSSRRMVSGIPAPSAVGTYSRAITSEAGGTHSFTLSIDALPDWAQGTFNGYLSEGGGTLSMSVSPQGKVTGKMTRAGKSYSFKSASYTGGDASTGFELATALKMGTEQVPLVLHVCRAADSDRLGMVRGVLGQAATPLVLFRNLWTESPAEIAPYCGYYTAALPGNAAYGSGYLTFTVNQAGTVKTVGKLADGTAFSLSGVLLCDETGRLFTWIETAPKTYAGGGLQGFVEFYSPEAGRTALRMLDGTPFAWWTLNPMATGTYGEGFTRELDLVGGSYSTIANLYDVYGDRVLSVDLDADAEAPSLAFGAERVQPDLWSPTGVSLIYLVKGGVLTGLTAPASAKPTDLDRDGIFEYDEYNPVGLTLALNRGTGIFKGSFNVWFNLPTNKRLSQKIQFEGVLNPTFDDEAAFCGDRGFFLWAESARLPSGGKDYRYNLSYDFLLRSE